MQVDHEARLDADDDTAGELRSPGTARTSRGGPSGGVSGGVSGTSSAAPVALSLEAFAAGSSRKPSQHFSQTTDVPERADGPPTGWKTPPESRRGDEGEVAPGETREAAAATIEGESPGTPCKAAGSGSVRIVGWVSKAEAGCGRAAGDRQFLYVNGRPVDMPRAIKVINDVFRAQTSPLGATATHKPVAILNMVVGVGTADVNVTPDKRKVSGLN